MATSFLISYPDIPAVALTWSSSQTWDTDYPLESFFYGERWNYAQLSSTQTSVTVTWDLGSSASTKAVNHFILGDATILLSAGVTEARVQGSTNGSVWVDQLGTAANFQTRTFYGPNSKDLLFAAGVNDTFSATLAAYRYWKLTLSGGAAHKFPFSKCYFGSWLDMGQEPSSYSWEAVVDDETDTWRYPRGHVTMNRVTHQRMRLVVTWEGVSDTVATSFTTNLLKNPYNRHVFLYTATNLDPLRGTRLVHARVLDSECTVERLRYTSSAGLNNVTAVFEECV